MAALALLSVVGINWNVAYQSAPYLYERGGPVPFCRVALVLGTSERLSTGKENLFFAYRMRAAARLYNERRCSILLVSGDNRTRFYNEPRMMRDALVGMGVPPSAIWTDYGGTRTLASVMRCHEVFGQDRFIVVSQRFHLERAVFLARGAGLEAVGYCAQDVEGPAAYSTHLREYLAKVVALWDLAGLPRD